MIFYFHLVSIESISKPLENLLYEYFEEITLINEKTRLDLENFTSFENINQEIQKKVSYIDSLM